MWIVQYIEFVVVFLLANRKSHFLDLLFKSIWIIDSRKQCHISHKCMLVPFRKKKKKPVGNRSRRDNFLVALCVQSYLENVSRFHVLTNLILWKHQDVAAWQPN
jgi:hypothetical protein